MAEQTSELRVRLVTPEKVLFEQKATSVLLPSTAGYFEVLPGHAPLIGELGAGEVTIVPVGESDGEVRYHVSWGFVEVLPERVTILASSAVKPDAIDLAAAEKQLDEGLELWKQAGDSAEAYDEALRVIAEAEAKISSASPAAKH